MWCDQDGGWHQGESQDEAQGEVDEGGAAQQHGQVEHRHQLQHPPALLRPLARQKPLTKPDKQLFTDSAHSPTTTTHNALRRAARLPVCVMRQRQARGVNGDGRQHHRLGLGHGEVLHSHLLEAGGQGVQRRSGQVADDQRRQHRQDAGAGHLAGSRFDLIPR